MSSNYLETSCACTCLPNNPNSENILGYFLAGSMRRPPTLGPTTRPSDIHTSATETPSREVLRVKLFGQGGSESLYPLISCNIYFARGWLASIVPKGRAVCDVKGFVTCDNAHADHLVLLGAYLRDHNLWCHDEAVHRSQEEPVERVRIKKFKAKIKRILSLFQDQVYFAWRIAVINKIMALCLIRTANG